MRNHKRDLHAGSTRKSHTPKAIQREYHHLRPSPTFRTHNSVRFGTVYLYLLFAFKITNILQFHVWRTAFCCRTTTTTAKSEKKSRVLHRKYCIIPGVSMYIWLFVLYALGEWLCPCVCLCTALRKERSTNKTEQNICKNGKKRTHIFMTKREDHGYVMRHVRHTRSRTSRQSRMKRKVFVSQNIHCCFCCCCCIVSDFPVRM